MYKLFVSLIIAMLWSACGDEQETQTPPTPDAVNIQTIQVPAFDEQKAYDYIAKQISFGHRIPGTAAHKKCAEWLIAEMKQLADTVYIQEAIVLQKATNKKYPITNIIGSFNPQQINRVLLLAHWDSRPWADEDATQPDKPILAADDGASGVAVLLAIANHLKHAKPEMGVDLLLVDAEDLGKSEWGDESYCLGSQYWSLQPHVAGYRAQYGICLDMVGAKGAMFPIEAHSDYYAPNLVKTIWQTGNQLGYSDYFRYSKAGPITDDHVFVNKNLNIPTVDIIHVNPFGGFGDHWHTHKDNLDVIDKKTLKAVGQTVLHVIYHL
jgi:Predicted aminopeptidases